MKSTVRKAALIAAACMVLAVGTASAQSAPTGPCGANGQMTVVEYSWGQRHYMCNNGQWRFMHECHYDGSGACIIL